MTLVIEDFTLSVKRFAEGVDISITQDRRVVAARALTFKEFVFVTRDMARVLNLPIYLGEPPTTVAKNT